MSRPVAPVLTVSGDPTDVTALPDDSDIDATAASVGDLIDRVRAVASDERTCTEYHGLDTFTLTRVGPSI
jgi:altronate dehydratase large subunit